MIGTAVAELTLCLHVESNGTGRDQKMSFTTLDSWGAEETTARQTAPYRVASGQTGKTRLEPARGILIALALTIPLWVIIASVVYTLI
jgi:hypothetical protein